MSQPSESPQSPLSHPSQGSPQPGDHQTGRDLRGLRRDYRSDHLLESNVPDTPFPQFQTWLDEMLELVGDTATRSEPTAMVISTASADDQGRFQPHSRVVLLKECTLEGLVFYTNHDSAKGVQLAENALASAVFWWPQKERQVRFEGVVEQVPREQSEAYFAVRPRGSQLGAWASRQSRPTASLQQMDDQYAAAEREFEGRDVPCPPFWGGYLLRPQVVEFWQGQSSRMHDRIRYDRDGEAWTVQRLQP